MPSKTKCAKEWKKLGYESLKDCTSYGKIEKEAKKKLKMGDYAGTGKRTKKDGYWGY
tara:strand:- start:18067 stop:18237 length:171 start_codon:yes stop_codon:yes gene_type:complete